MSNHFHKVFHQNFTNILASQIARDRGLYIIILLLYCFIPCLSHIRGTYTIEKDVFGGHTQALIYTTIQISSPIMSSSTTFASSDNTMGDSSPPNFTTPTACVGTKGAKPVVILEIGGMHKEIKRLEKQVGNLVGQLTILENKHDDLQAEHDQLLKDFTRIKQWLRKNEEGRQAEEDKKRVRLEEEEVGSGDGSDLEVMTADKKARVAASLEASCSNLMKVQLAIYSCILP